MPDFGLAEVLYTVYAFYPPSYTSKKTLSLDG